MNWLWSGIMFVVTIILFFMVVQGVIYIGWALGGVVGFILAILLAMELIDDTGFWGGLIGVVIIALLFQFLV